MVAAALVGSTTEQPIRRAVTVRVSGVLHKGLQKEALTATELLEEGVAHNRCH